MRFTTSDERGDNMMLMNDFREDKVTSATITVYIIITRLIFSIE